MWIRIEGFSGHFDECVMCSLFLSLLDAEMAQERRVRCCVKLWLGWTTKAFGASALLCLSLCCMMTWNEPRWEQRWTGMKTCREKLPFSVKLLMRGFWWGLGGLAWDYNCTKFIIVLSLKSGLLPSFFEDFFQLKLKYTFLKRSCYFPFSQMPCWFYQLLKSISRSHRVLTGTTGKATSSLFLLWRWRWGRSTSVASAARGGGLRLNKQTAFTQPRVKDKRSLDNV